MGGSYESAGWTSDRWRRIAAVFERAATLPVNARGAFLRTVQELDPELAQEATTMLAADAQLIHDTAPSIRDVLVEACDPVLPVGARLGAYAIESGVAAGGMGRVYRARCGTQVVAIKCPRFAKHDPQAAGSLLREREILARLDHPNIARLLDAGTDPRGHPFLVLDYIDGVTIAEFVSARRLSLPARLQILRKVMGAVAYVHQQGIVHRDIKPGNILVDATGEPHLLDFGIAATHGTATAAEQVQAGEPRRCTPSYVAPEQLRGDPPAVSNDIYALGVLSYELLCGQSPWTLPALAEARRRKPWRRPAPPSRRVDLRGPAPDGSSSAHWRRALRGDLDEVVMRALRWKPGQRHASVAAFRHATGRHLANEPTAGHARAPARSPSDATT